MTTYSTINAMAACLCPRKPSGCPRGVFVPWHPGAALQERAWHSPSSSHPAALTQHGGCFPSRGAFLKLSLAPAESWSGELGPQLSLPVTPRERLCAPAAFWDGEPTGSSKPSTRVARLGVPDPCQLRQHQLRRDSLPTRHLVFPSS